VGCDVPVAAFSPSPAVAREVSRAGGVGVLGAAVHALDDLGTALDGIREGAGGRPWGVNVLFPAGPVAPVKAELDDAHLRFVARLEDTFEIPAPSPLPPVTPFGDASVIDLEDAADKALLALEYGCRLIVSALGPLPPDVSEAARARGALIGGMAGSARHAAKHVAAGADVVIAQGYEAAGHSGEITTMVLVPEVVEAAGSVPVLAAGGIGTGRQLAAALSLGAAGAWTGSIWLTTPEGAVDPVVVARLLAAGSADTVRNRTVTGKPMRQLRTAWTDALDAADAPEPLPAPLQGRLLRDLLVGIYEHRVEAAMGSAIGQVVGQLRDVCPAGEVLATLVADCRRTLDELADLAA
jgi:NAD(P)H-dependent flavin oxidoreductase YrpB (nitropropane dioxygenase family)